MAAHRFVLPQTHGLILYDFCMIKNIKFSNVAVHAFNRFTTNTVNDKNVIILSVLYK